MDKINVYLNVKGEYNVPEFEVFTELFNMMIYKINELNDEISELREKVLDIEK